MNNEKMIKLAGNLDLFANVFGKIFSVFGIVCLIVAVGSFFLEGSDLTDISISMGIAKIYLNNNVEVNAKLMKYCLIICVFLFGIICLLIGYIIKLARTMLIPMKNGRPFEEDVPKTLRKIAWLVLGEEFLFQFLKLITKFLLSKSIPLEQILVQDVISKIEYNYTMDFRFVLIFAILMFLSYIFSYGVSLQRESDETL